jgi:hypothetical protein
MERRDGSVLSFCSECIPLGHMKKLVLVALLAAPGAAFAQASSSIALGAGFMTFGTRLEREDATFEYANSMSVELRAEKSLGRRFGVMVAGMIAPFSAQRATIGDFGVFDDVTAFGGELALSFRFKPTAPIYFYGGAAFMHFSDYSDPREVKKGVNEPGAAFGMGFDLNTSRKYNVRFQLGLHLMKPADGDQWEGPEGLIPSPNTAKSLTQDWSFSIALRRSSRQE